MSKPEKTFEVELKRPAKSQGGDRYETNDVEGEPKPWVVYIPQAISRNSGTPADHLTLTITS